MTCNLEFKVSSESMLSIKGAVNAAIKYQRNEGATTQQFMDKMWTQLLSGSTFNPLKDDKQTDPKEVYPQLLKALNQVIESNKFIAEDLKAEIVKALPNFVWDSLGYGEQYTPEDQQTLLVIMEQEDDRVIKKEHQIGIDAAYGNAELVKSMMIANFGSSILNATIIDFKSGRIVKNKSDINKNVADYKNELFASICKQLGISQQGFYGVDGKVDMTLLHDVLNKYREQVFSKTTDNDLMNAFFNISAIDSNGYSYNKTFLDAFNAYMILTNFDDLVTGEFGKILKVPAYLKGKEANLSVNKYKFTMESNFTRDWHRDDGVSALDELGSIPKLLINNTPMVDINGNPINQNLSAAMFLGTFNKLFDPSNRKYVGQLAPLLDAFHDAPNYYFGEILKVMNAPGFIWNSAFNIIDKNVIATVYKTFFNTHNPNSLYNILKREEAVQGQVMSYNALEDIIGMIDRSGNATYRQYSKGNSTEVNGHIIKNSSYSKLSIQLKEGINNYIHLNSNRNKLIESNNVVRTGQSVSAEIEGLVIQANPYKNNEVTLTQDGKQFSLNTILTNESMLLNYLNKLIKQNQTKQPQSFTKEEQIANKVLNFIDEFTGLNLAKVNPDLLMVYYSTKVKNGKESFFTDLVNFAAKGAIVNSLLLDHKNSKNGGTFIEYIIDNEPEFKDLYTDSNDRAKYFINVGQVEKLSVLSTVDAKKLDDLAIAKQVLTGESVKTVTKNISKNNVANNKIANLAMNIRNYIKDAINSGNPSENLLFAKNMDLIDSVQIRMDIENRNGVKKEVKACSIAELNYISMIFDFYGSMYDNDSVIIQPTTYSDKTAFYVYGIKMGAKLPNGKTLKTSSNEEILQLRKETTGKYYSAIFNQVMQDYSKVFDFRAHPERLLALNLENDADLLALSDRIEQSAVIKDQITLLQSNAIKENIAQIKELTKQLKSLELSALDKVKYYDVLLNHCTEDLYNGWAKESNVDNVKFVHYHPLGKTGKLKINPVLAMNGAVYFDRGNAYEKRIEDEIFEFTNTLLSNNLHLNTLYADGKQNQLLKEIIKKEKLSDWEKDGELIIAKDEDDNVIRTLKKGQKFTLNPALLRYFHVNSFLAENLRLTLTGSEIAHPDKANSKVDIFAGDKVDKDMYIKQESGTQLAQLKRNVIIPATLQYVSQNTISGVPSEYKVAIIKDMGAYVHNFRGMESGVDAHDGSAFINPFISLLENLSLQSNSVGVDKKPIWHDYNHTYGIATELKFATFTMTNERMRRSTNSPASLYRLMQKMTDIKWFKDGQWETGMPIDLTVNFKGEKIDFQSLLEGKRLFVKEGIEHVEITGIEKVGDTEYKILRRSVLDDGTPLMDGSDLSKTVTINSLFDLYEAMGGRYSEELGPEGNLIFGESSSQVTTAFINNIGTTTAQPGELYNQANTKQPLKQMMISYAANNSAIKNGATNTNDKKAWTSDGELSYMIIKSKGLGMQMDADHHADESTMTEFSQVLSSLEANGNTHTEAKQVYKDLAKIALTSLSVEMNALDEALILKQDSTIPKSVAMQNLYEVIGRLIINSYSESSKLDEAGLTGSILKEIAKNFDIKNNQKLREILIPFSDASIFNSIIPDLVSYINGSAIKRKYPGSGSVMIPSYGMIQNYKIGGNNFTWDDLLREASLDPEVTNETKQRIATITETIPDYRYNINDELIKTYLQKEQNKEPIVDNTDQFMIGEIVNIYVNGKLQEYVKIETFDDYINFKNGALKTLLTIPVKPEDVITYQKNVTHPHDLQPQRIEWQVNGRNYNAFDLDIVQRNYLARKNKADKQTLFLLQKELQKAFSIMDSGKYAPLTVDMIKAIKDPNVLETLKDRLTTIDGVPCVIIDEGSFNNKPAELVVSKMYASKFGLLSDESLVNVKKQGYQYFENKGRKIAPTTQSYDFALLKENGKHVYFALSDSKQIPSDKEELEFANTKRIGDKIYSVNRKGEVEFVIGEYKLQENLIVEVVGEEKKYYLQIDAVEYTDTNGNTVKKPAKKIEVTNVELRDDGYYVFDQYVTKYKTYEIGTKVQKVNTLYVLNKSTFNNSTSGNTVLEDIAKSQGFHSVSFNNNLHTKSAKKFINKLASLRLSGYQGDYITNLNKYLHTAPTEMLDFKRINFINNGNVRNQAKIKYASFLKSLEFTVSRIPAQTLQSFMKMEVTHFTNVEKNVCYVPSSQIWLEGSDYATL